MIIRTLFQSLGAAALLSGFLAASPPASSAAKAPVSAESGRGDYWLGKDVYEEICFSCHGMNGNGKGPSWRSSRPRPQVFISRTYMKRMTDEYIFAIVKFGKMNVLKEKMKGFKLKKSRPTAMPAFGEVLEDEQIRKIIQWERGFTTGSQIKDEETKEIFIDACSQCHGKKGRGNGERPTGDQDPNKPFVSEIQPPPMDYTQKELMARFDDEFLFNLIKLGRLDVTEQAKFDFMKAYGHVLNDDEIWGVVRYVRETFINGKPRRKKK
ncbi:MAG: c-type cytochrome [bacterium]